MQKLLELEKMLFDYSYISDRAWLENTIHDDFAECGRSGMLFNKHDVIQSLLECKESRKIEIYNFACRRIDEKSWLVNYITMTDDGQKYFRTSVWVEHKKMQLFFHQATVLNEDIDLIKY